MAVYTEQALTAGVALIIIFIVFTLTKKKRNLPPGIKGWPVIGNLLMIKKHPRTFELFSDLSKTHGSVYRITLGIIDFIVVNKQKEMSEALVQKSMDFAGRPKLFSLYLMSDGGKDIFMAEPDEMWQLSRKIVHTAVRNHASGKTMEDNIQQEFSAAVLKCKEIDQKEPFEVEPLLRRVVHNNISKILFGSNLTDEDVESVIAINDKAQKVLASGHPADIFPFLKYFPLKITKDMKAFMKEYEGYHLTKYYTQHTQSYDPDHITDVCYQVIKEVKDLQQTNPEVAKNYTEAHIIQVLSDFYGAGTDTTAFTTKWLVLYMATHQEIQEKMNKEIISVVGDRQPALSDRQKLPYTMAVITEIMRIRPIGPLLVHRTTCDTTLGGYDIPKDTNILFNLWGLHMDEELWPEPNTFKPERFLSDDGTWSGKDATTMLPFGVGKRSCAGEAMGRASVFLMTCNMFQRFKFTLAEGGDLTPRDDIFQAVPKPFKVIASTW